jgi:hypothetical protein
MRLEQADYFSDLTLWNNRPDYLNAVKWTLESGCERVGIDIEKNQIEYPYQALLLRANPSIRFQHTGVHNGSERYARPEPQAPPCLVFCPDCAGVREKLDEYRAFGEPLVSGRFLLFRGASSVHTH